MAVNVYGIPNCDSVKKARTWLDQASIQHEFVNFKKSPPEASLIQRWVDQAGLERVLNKRGTTWRKLSDEQKAQTEMSALVQLMSEQPSLIKRPVIETEGELLVGFNEEQYQHSFNNT